MNFLKKLDCFDIKPVLYFNKESKISTKFSIILSAIYFVYLSLISYNEIIKRL